MLGAVILKHEKSIHSIYIYKLYIYIESMNSWRGKHDIEILCWKYSIQNKRNKRTLALILVRECFTF
jgi:hypothetical protein